jgi:hypothetical protein
MEVELCSGRRGRLERRTARGLWALALVAAHGCVRPVAISALRQRSTELQGKPVTVEGQVSRSIDLPLLHDHFYQIDDGTGQIWVQTTQATPAEGQRVRVTGTLGPGMKLPGAEVGLVIVESQRQ